MPVLNITGSLSPHIDDTVTFNGRLEPTKTNWMKVIFLLCLTNLYIVWNILMLSFYKFLDKRLWPCP
jgi:hypothetical protein